MSDVDEKNPPPPSVENGATQQPPPAAADATPDPLAAVQEKLAESLKNGTLGDVITPEPEAEQPKPAAKPTEPAKEPEAKSPDASKATEAVEDPDELFDEEDDVRPDEVDPKFTKIRGRIQSQQAKLREARKELAEHRRQRETAKMAGFDDKSFEDWVLLGARANMGDPAAISELARRVQTAGYKFAPAEPATPAKPAEPTEQEVQAIYAKHFKPRVEAYQMDEAAALDAAKSLAAEIRASRAHAPSQPPVLSQPQQIPPQAPGRQAVDPIRQRIDAHMDQLDAGYAKALPNWAEVKAEADKLVKADIQAGKVLDPLMWPSDWQLKVRQAQIRLAQRKAKAAAPAVRVADTNLRPGRGSSPVGGSGKTSAEEHRQRLAEALRTGNLDDLP